MRDDIARACAKGWRQNELITELLTLDPVPVVYTRIPGQYSGRVQAKVGKAEVQWSSWTPLRKRLQDAGFRFTRGDHTITLMVPHYGIVPSVIML